MVKIISKISFKEREIKITGGKGFYERLTSGMYDPGI